MVRTNEPVFMISIVAHMLSIHPQTLRLYEREGFIKPSRTLGNTRLYSQDDVEEIRTVLRLTRELGVNLAGVDIILNMKERVEMLQAELNAVLQTIEERHGAEARREIEAAVAPTEAAQESHVIRVKIEREG
ncbi:MAG: helix-turn-helix transcriptional regulator [Nitrospinae bacterium]|nr:helix-turn-helix transcriptional regulator [Nitrospinota bacterium]MCH7767841.1 helix-turn-helix transcriptional regulator [Nitrospinota bacterium]